MGRGSRDKRSRVGCNLGDVELKTIAALISSLCGCESGCAQTDWFAKSLMVSVAMQNKGGNFFHPMVRVRGMDTSGLSLSYTGNMRPIFGVSAG